MFPVQRYGCHQFGNCWERQNLIAKRIFVCQEVRQVQPGQYRLFSLFYSSSNSPWLLLLGLDCFEFWPFQMSPFGKNATHLSLEERITAIDFSNSPLQYYLVSYKLLWSKNLTNPIQLTRANVFGPNMLAVNWRVRFTNLSPQTSRGEKASPKSNIIWRTISRALGFSLVWG